MSVLFVHEGYISKHKGEYYSSSYDNAMVRRYSVLSDRIVFFTRIAPYDECSMKKKIDVKGFGFIGVENFKTLNGIKKFPAVKEKLRKAVLEADYVIARLPGNLGSLAVRYARRYNKKYLIELVGCVWDALSNYSLFGKVLAPFEYISTQRTLINAPYVVYVTSGFLQSRYPTKGCWTNCSNVYLPYKRYFDLDAKIKKASLLENREKIILGTAAVIHLRYKGHKYVIQAISELKKEGYFFEYQLAGDGDGAYLKSVVKKYGVEDQVRFIGALSHEQVFDWHQGIDIYVQPSETEGLPRALIEAMSSGCVCIGSNAGGIPELLPKDNIFDKCDVGSLKRILVDAVEKGYKTVGTTYDESGKYDREIVEKRRRDFFLAFAQNLDS